MNGQQKKQKEDPSSTCRTDNASSCRDRDGRKEPHFDDMNTVQSALTELKMACRHTLHEEVDIFHNRRSSNSSSHAHRNKKRQRTLIDSASDASAPDVTSNGINISGSISSGGGDAKSTQQCTKSRTWTEIVQDLCNLMSFLTDEQYEETARLMSICLLTYVIPRRCNVMKDNLSANGNCNPNVTTTSSPERKKKEVLRSLEEILHDSPQTRNMPSSQFSFSHLPNERVSSAFWDFLHHGLAPFISMRLRRRSAGAGAGVENSPYYSGSADLLHVLAMMICGDIPQSARTSALMGSDDDGNEISFGLSDRVKKFMSNHHPRYFQISALQRGEVVRVLSNSLALSKINASSKDEVQSLFMGGILHLRAALKAFGSSLALTNHQIIDTKRILNTIAIDTECFAHNEMRSLVSNLLNDRTKFGPCAQCSRLNSTGVCPASLELKCHNKRYMYNPAMAKARVSTLRQQIVRQQELSVEICIHCSTGDLLRDLILRYNGCRHYADGKFSSQTVAELTAAIATILGEIDSSVDQDSVDKSALPTSCAIIGLLNAARALYYFLLSPDSSGLEEQDDDTTTAEVKEAQALENVMKEALVDCVMQFLESHNSCVMEAASSMLANAFAYEKRSRVQTLVGKIFLVLQRALQKPGACEALKEVIEVLSRISEKFAISVVLFLIGLLKERGEDEKRESLVEESTKSTAKSIAQLLAKVALVQPRATAQYFDTLQDCISMFSTNKYVMKQLVAILLSSRLANPFVEKEHQKVLLPKIDNVLDASDPWTIFQIGRHALCTGNYQVASNCFGMRLQKNTSTSSSYLWLSILSSVAMAESALLEEGNNAIPISLTKLCSALNQARALESHPISSITFQEEIIALRIDFLELCLAALNLSGEARLTNTLGRFSRDGLHQRNLPRCFYMLASRYATVYRRYGLFYCQQTRSTLRCLGAVSKFLGDMISKIFSSPKSERGQNSSTVGEFPTGDMSRVQIQLTDKLRKDLLEYCDSSIQPKIRAMTLISVLDSFMKCPTAYPRGFTTLKQIPSSATIYVSSMDLSSCENSSRLNYFEVQLGRPLGLRINGYIPESFFRAWTVPCSQVAVTCLFSFDGPLVRDYDGDEKNMNLREDGEVRENVTTSTELLPSSPNLTKNSFGGNGSRFILNVDLPVFPREGYYSVEIKLHVRDVRCGEFDVESNMDGENIVVKASHG